jgi:desulfoferrodoxin (superoxide reductase-like protein)
MKRLIILLIVSFVFLFVVSTLYAHPPSDIKITFDPKTKMLQVVIMHNTSNPMSHYIKKIDVGLNGKEIIEQNISAQDNNDSQRAAYFIPDAKDGDLISVEGYCSISGKLEKEITVKTK